MEVPVRAVGAKVLSPVATAATMIVFAVRVVTETDGLAAVVALTPEASRAQVLPAAALNEAIYVHMLSAPSFGTARVSAWETGGASMYQTSREVSVTPCSVSAWVSATPL